MRVEVNGRPRDIADSTTLIALIQSLAGSTRGSAAVIDDEVVPRSEWATRALKSGQRIEVITAVQGG